MRLVINPPQELIILLQDTKNQNKERRVTNQIKIFIAIDLKNV